MIERPTTRKKAFSNVMREILCKCAKSRVLLCRHRWNACPLHDRNHSTKPFWKYTAAAAAAMGLRFRRHFFFFFSLCVHTRSLCEYFNILKVIFFFLLLLFLFFSCTLGRTAIASGITHSYETSSCFSARDTKRKKKMTATKDHRRLGRPPVVSLPLSCLLDNAVYRGSGTVRVAQNNIYQRINSACMIINTMQFVTHIRVCRAYTNSKLFTLTLDDVSFP